MEVKPGRKRVFDVQGAFGSMEAVADAYQSMLMRLTLDPKVALIESKVVTDGTYTNILYGEQPRITGYLIDVEYVANDQ